MIHRWVGIFSLLFVLLGAVGAAIGFGLPHCIGEPACLAIVDYFDYANCTRKAANLNVGMPETEAQALGVQFEPGTRRGAPIQIGRMSCTRPTGWIPYPSHELVYEGTEYRVYVSGGHVDAVMTQSVTLTHDTGWESQGAAASHE